MIYRPLASDEIKKFIRVWINLSLENGLKGIYFIGHLNQLNYSVADVLSTGVDGVNTTRLTNYNYNHQSLFSKILNKTRKLLFNKPYTFSYKLMSKYFIVDNIDKLENIFPSIIPGWDHSPRSGTEGLIITDSNPELFGKHIKYVINIVKDKNYDNRLIFLKSWNEWAEGNYVEPDLRWGLSFLKAIKNQVFVN